MVEWITMRQRTEQLGSKPLLMELEFLTPSHISMFDQQLLVVEKISSSMLKNLKKTGEKFGLDFNKVLFLYRFGLNLRLKKH